MRFLLLLLPVFGFAQTGFRAEFNYLVSGTPSQGGDYRLTGLYSDGDALGFPVDSVVAGSYFYDSKGLPYEIVYSSRSQPLTIEVDRVGHLIAPTIGLGLLTDRTSRKLLPYETSKIAGKLRSIIEVEARKLTDVDANKLAELLDVDTSGLADAYMIRYNADSAKWYVYPNNIDGLTDGYFQGSNMFIGVQPTNLTTGFSNVNAGRLSGNALSTGSENTNIGDAAGYLNETGNRNTNTGRVAGGYNVSGSNNSNFGAFAGLYNYTGSLNVNIGSEAIPQDTSGSNNVNIGGFVNSSLVFSVPFESFGYTQMDSVVTIGARARSLNPISTNEITIGAFATGNGSNTATLGNDNITGTYLKGNINLRGYGAGNKEAGDLSKTATNYVLRPASDGTILEQVNNIDGLADGRNYTGWLSVGNKYTIGNTGSDNVFFTKNSNDTLANTTGGSNTAIGYNAMRLGVSGYQNTGTGRSAMVNLLSGSNNTASGALAGWGNKTGSNNTYGGYYVNALDSIGSNNTMFGDRVNTFGFDVTFDWGRVNADSVAIFGANSRTKDTISTNEIVIGAFATGNGSNTATFGNNNITATYLKGTTNLRGYGAGNKEAADLSKTSTDYVLRPASDGTILEQINNIDGLTDGYLQNRNLYLIGFKPDSLTTGIANSNFGFAAGWENTTGQENVNIGDVAGYWNRTGSFNTNTGRRSGLYNYTGSYNSNFGAYANAQDTLGGYNVNIGAYVNSNAAFGQDTFALPGYTQKDSVVAIGAYARSLNPISTNEITIGAFATGNGSNTATFGNDNITATYLKGTTNLSGYGLGNKEASDLSKTGSGYFLEVATDGTLIESTVTGGGGATNLGDLGDVTITSATTGQVLKYNGAEWINAAESGGIALTDLSVTTNAAGSAALSYNNTNGVFSFTPPDLSSYLTSEVDGSVTNEIQDLSLTGNTLSLSEDATTVDLSGYLDDQTVSLTGAGITTISGTYPNFTITSTEVDGSTTNELQTLSFNDATRQLTLSDDGTIDLSEGIQDEIAATLVQGEGITITYNDVAGTITIAAPSGAGNTDEQTLSINSATAELSISNGNTVDLSEAIDNQVNTLLVDGTNILSTYDDGANTLTVRTTDALTQIDAITFDNNTTDAVTGRLQYNQEIGILVMGLQNNTPLQLGIDMGWYVKNQSGASIAKGTAVYVSGTDGNSGRKLIAPMIANGTINAKLFLGITAETIANGGDGLVLDHGGIRGVNLSAFSANDLLYVSTTVAGALTTTEPTAPNLKLPIGYVVNNSSNGSLSIRATVGTYLSENHDVQIAGASNGQVLKYDGTKWVNSTDLVNDADADPNNEIQDLSLSGNTLSLSGDASTVDLSGYLDDQAVSLTGAGITAISGTYPNFTITSTEVDGSVSNEGLLSASTLISGSVAALTSNTSGGSIVEFRSGTGMSVSTSGGNAITYTNTLPEATTVSNGLTETGNNIELGGTLTKATQINLPANGSLIMGDLTNAPATALAVLDANNTVVTYGTAVLADYGSNNKKASDLSVTPSNYKAAFATDGTLIEVSNIDAMVIACSDETTDIATGTAKVTFRAPFAMTITGVRASLATASSSGDPTVDINEAGVSILGTKLSIDANEKTSTTAASAATITDTAIADDAEITIDIDAAGTGAKGLKVTILYRK